MVNLEILREILALQDKDIKEKQRRHSLNEEHKMQCAQVRYMQAKYPELKYLFFAVPNGQKRTTRQAAWLKMEGMVPGVSDMILLMPNARHPYLCIENKTAKGKQTAEQIAFQRAVEQNGGKYIVVRSLDEFIENIEHYLHGEI